MIYVMRLRFGGPTAVMAKIMGHSPTVHLQTYNGWLSEEGI